MKTNFLKLFTIMSVIVAFTFSLSSQNLKGVELTGSGATFPEPLYKKMFDEYNKSTGAKVNYQGIGSGGGIKQLTEKVTDFGGTDAFMSEDEMKKTGADIIHIPTCIGAVVVTYNLPGNPKLRMSSDVITDIFLGKILKWNDPKIAAENTGVKLPDLKISTVHRSDGSGTTFVFTDYLSKVSKEWKEKVGTDKSPKWLTGLGGKGNPGVAGLVTQIPGSIGYVELIYALQNKMAFVDVKNKSGNYVTASLKTSSLSADIALPNDTRISITDTDAKDGYPISSFTWLILYKEQNYNNRTETNAKAVTNLAWWVIHEGQQFPEKLDYSPLPKSAIEKAEKLLKSVAYNGKPILK